MAKNKEGAVPRNLFTAILEQVSRLGLASTLRVYRQPDEKDRGDVVFFGWCATSGVQNRCFGVLELNSCDDMDCLGVLSRFGNRMYLVYHWNQD